MTLFLLLVIGQIYTIDTIDAIGNTADLIPELLPEAQVELYKTGKTSRFYFTGENFSSYLPRSPMADEIVRQLGSLGPNIGVETLYIFEAPGIFQDDNLSDLKLYNLLRGLSSLKGIEYYSASRKRMRTFFKEFHTISDPHNKTPNPDIFVSSIPEEDILFAFQEDLTFGENISKLQYRYESPFISISISNMEKMRFAFIPLIQEGDMQMHLIIYILDGYILFYGNCAVKTIDFFGLVKNKKDSFSNRIEAMYQWFRGEFDKTILTNN